MPKARSTVFARALTSTLARVSIAPAHSRELMAKTQSISISEAQRGDDPPLWWLYLLACKDGRTYVGIAIDVDARFQAHLSGKGARFTRSNPPLAVLGAQSFATKSEALKAEAALKKLPREQRLAWARRWMRTDAKNNAQRDLQVARTPATLRAAARALK
jgi:putative endonuclease